ncbi:aspartyl-phosphate phosphatase Spo0E family protein [Clostridium sp.]|uniref:aspartyl-phosphate phosphatase Spo0E family protein n=1 Tax=Clostridium sp. TaxID=1506 RepID=UPI003D6CA657
MDKLNLGNNTIEHLENCINDLRAVLNEICCTDEEADADIEVDVKKLNISRELDGLIVEYMRKTA